MKTILKLLIISLILTGCEKENQVSNEVSITKRYFGYSETKTIVYDYQLNHLLINLSKIDLSDQYKSTVKDGVVIQFSYRIGIKEDSCTIFYHAEIPNELKRVLEYVNSNNFEN